MEGDNLKKITINNNLNKIKVFNQNWWTQELNDVQISILALSQHTIPNLKIFKDYNLFTIWNIFINFININRLNKTFPLQK
jgi:hypothetical protein